MGPTTEKTVFIIENYSHPYGIGRGYGLNLKQLSEKYRQQFNIAAPSKSVTNYWLLLY